MKPTGLACSSAALLHPITLVALALWAINDHLLQGWGPGVLTGKLSGVAGLVVCPTVLFGILEWCAPRLVRRHRRAALAVSCAVPGLLVVGLELSAPMDLVYRHALGGARFVAAGMTAWLSGGAAPAHVLARTTPDVTDLLTLPALALPWWLGARGARELTLQRMSSTLTPCDRAGSRGVGRHVQRRARVCALLAAPVHPRRALAPAGRPKQPF